MAVAATRSEILVLQFAEGDDLSDAFGMCPLLNRKLIAACLAKDDDIALALSTDQELALLARDLHRT